MPAESSDNQSLISAITEVADLLRSLGTELQKLKEPRPLLYTIEETAELLKISAYTAYEMAREGELPVVRFRQNKGRQIIRVRPQDLDDFILKNTFGIDRKRSPQK